MGGTLTAQRIRQGRRALDLTQEQFAEKCDVNRVTVSSWENGKYAPEGTTLQRVASVLNVTTDYLMGRTSETKKSPIESIDGGIGKGKGKNGNWAMIDYDVVPVPIISREMTACCGKGIPELDITNESTEYIYRQKTIFHPYDDSRRPFAVHCEGNCLESDGIHDGMTAIVNPAEEPVNGAMALVCLGGRMSIKHIFQLPSGVVVLKSDIGERRMTLKDQAELDFEIIGTVVSWDSGRPKNWSL